MKKRLAFLLTIFLLLMITSFSFAAIELPDYHSHRLTDAELKEFFSAESPWVDLSITQLMEKIYQNIENKKETVYGMNFKALETPEEAQTKPYANYIADFVLTTNTDAHVLLVGNYGEFGTIPLGILEIKAGEDFRVMRHAPFGDWTYLSIVTSVKDFDCAAIPVTAELIDAFEKAGVDPFDQFGLSKNDLLPSNTTFTLSLNLFETDENGEETGKRWILGDIEPFTYKPLKVLPSAPTLPKTGDSSTPLLWMTLVVLSASAILMIRRKVYNR